MEVANYSNYSGLLADMQKRETDAYAANKAIEMEIRGIYDNLIARSSEGGAAKTAGMAEIELGKTRAIGAGTQQMISSGLFGTTTAASIPVQAENQASLSRLKLEDMLEQRTQELKLGKAGFAERIDNPYPDYNMLLQAMMAQGSQNSQNSQQQPTGTWGAAPRPTDSFDYWSSMAGIPGSTAKEQARYH